MYFVSFLGPDCPAIEAGQRSQLPPFSRHHTHSTILMLKMQRHGAQLQLSIRVRINIHLAMALQLVSTHTGTAILTSLSREHKVCLCYDIRCCCKVLNSCYTPILAMPCYEWCHHSRSLIWRHRLSQGGFLLEGLAFHCSGSTLRGNKGLPAGEGQCISAMRDEMSQGIYSYIAYMCNAQRAWLTSY